MAEVTVTERAVEVLRRGFETARLSAAEHGVRVRVVGGTARTSFAEEPEPEDQIVTAGEMRVFVDRSLAARDRLVIDVSAEHDQLIVR